MNILEVSNLTKQFGGLIAINDLSLYVSQNEILGLIGPNGSGKSTFINVISGFYPATRGKLLFDGRDITGYSSHQIAKLGIGRTFQASTLFTEISVLDNVFTGYHMSYKTNIFKQIFRTSSVRNEEKLLKQKSIEILEFMGLAGLKDELARNLPHGNQRILGICMALATNPKLLLLDEPATGMNISEIQTLISLINKIRDRGTTIILIEHHMETIMNLCNRIVVLNYGQKIAEGSPSEIQDNEQVIEAYLGKE